MKRIFLCMGIIFFNNISANTPPLSADVENFMAESYALFKENKEILVTISDDEQELEEPDPLEALNRAFFSFNYLMDGLFLKPMAILYRDAVNPHIKDGIENFIGNLFSPLSVINNFFQGEGEKAFQMMGRFFVNSTVGLLGIFDVATHMEIGKHETSLNETFARWGVETGPYLMLPFLGPTSFRGGFGMLGDVFLNPFRYLTNSRRTFGPANTTYKYILLGAYGIDIVTRRSKLIEATDMIEKDSLDIYATVRSIYFQKQQEITAS
jgi:phospholipid-binding lipoprotein MlaA